MAEGWNSARPSSCRNPSKMSTGLNSSSDTMNSINRSSNMCRFYLQGRCCFGDDCRFSHQQQQPHNRTDSTSNNNNENSCSNNHQSSSTTNDQSTNTSITTLPLSNKPNPDKCHKKSKVNSSKSIGNIKSELADLVNAPEFVPKSAAKTYASAVEPTSNSSGSSSEPILCPYAMIGECRYGDNCLYLHGNPCDLCGKLCLHPTDTEQRKQHSEECLKEHERDMELSFAVQRSQEKCCGICMDTVMEKEAINERRFGILENCNHVFCLSCIRKWRSAKQFENKIVKACPECRVCSDFVTPSTYWVEAEEDKVKLIESYKKALSKKPCKYFMEGRGECPFAGNCFYLHAYPDGRKADLPPPQPRRRRCNHTGEFDDLPRNILWDIIDERDSRYMFLDLEEMLDFMIGSDDESDFSDFEYFVH